MNFVAIDFETANPKRYSACSLALTVVKNNQIADQFYSLIKPDTDFSWRNIQVHGITEKQIQNAPSFPELWPHIQNFFTPNNLIVAHNASFDSSVLLRTLEHYDITLPHYQLLDTLRTSKKFFKDFENHKLDTICNNLNIDLKHHHNALFDSTACAEILLYQANLFGEDQLQPFIKIK